MADVLLATEQLVRGGLAAAYTGSLNGSDIYQVQNEGTTILHVKNLEQVSVLSQSRHSGLWTGWQLRIAL